MNYREELARSHGFQSFAELLDCSDPLPLTGENVAPTYVARHADGYWFVWDDKPLASANELKRPPGEKGEG